MPSAITVRAPGRTAVGSRRSGDAAVHPVHVGGVPGGQPRRERRGIEGLGAREADQGELAGVGGGFDGGGGEHSQPLLSAVAWPDVSIASTESLLQNQAAGGRA